MLLLNQAGVIFAGYPDTAGISEVARTLYLGVYDISTFLVSIDTLY